MPKMQVYLPEDLYAGVKARGASINVSAILQEALKEALAALERREALGKAIAGYEADFGTITEKDVAAAETRDRARARRPSLRRRRMRAA